MGKEPLMPAMRNKSRLLGDIGNKSNASFAAGKSAAVERQRLMMVFFSR